MRSLPSIFVRPHLTALAVASLAWLPAAAGAIPLTEWGTRTVVSSANCPSFCTDFDFGTTGGGYQLASAASSHSDAQGNAQASAVLDPGSGLALPVLKAEAFSGGGFGSAFGTAWGIEGFTYNGAVAKDFILDVSLTGSAFDASPADGETDIQAEVWLFTAAGFEFFFDIPTLLFEIGAEPKLDLDGFDATLELSIDGLDPVNTTPVSGSIEFNLAPGEQVYLWASVGADAERDGSFADAFSTLTTTFQDPGGLSAASTAPIPEPGTALLLASGLAGLAGLSGVRRR